MHAYSEIWTGAVKAHQRADYGQASSGKVLSLSFSLLARVFSLSLFYSVCVCARALGVDVEGLHQVVYDALAEGTPSFLDEVKILSSPLYSLHTAVNIRGALRVAAYRRCRRWPTSGGV